MEPSTDIVLRRAVELAHREMPNDIVALRPVQLGQADLEEIAAELEIPPSAVSAALAEAAAGVIEEPSWLDRLVGPDQIWARGTVDADDEGAEQRLIEWLESGHGLRTRRRPDGAVVAAKRRDLVGKVARTVRNAQGTGELGKVRTVTGVVVDGNQGDGAVVLVADVSDKRNEAMLGGSFVAIGGAGAVGAVAVLFTPLALAGLPVALGAGAIASRLMFRSSVDDATHGVEATVDSVTAGTAPPRVLDPVRRTLRDRATRPRRPRHGH